MNINIKMRFLLRIAIIAAIVVVGMVSCKKYLNVESQTSLSGNNYWKTPKDVENFTNTLYYKLRLYTMINTPYFVYSGDLRNSYWRFSGNSRGNYNNSSISYLTNNDLKSLFALNGAGMDDWSSYYTLISDANILYKNVDLVPATAMSYRQRASYKGEAVFMRCLAYFILVRLYGDVPYNTIALNAAPLPRTPQVTVFNNCIEDLEAVVNDLPWTITNGNTFNTRANKGAALDLMMNMAMWNANFDAANAHSYYHLTDSLGDQLLNNSDNSYSLQPLNNLSDSKNLFLGNTNESLFVIPQNALIKTEAFASNSEFANLVLTGTDITPNSFTSKSTIYLDSKFLSEKLFPTAAGNDNRYSIWFGSNPAYIKSTTGDFEFFKFYNIDQQNGGVLDPKIFFRLPDAILLRAEALNKMGMVSEATVLLNMIRQRAGASNFISSGSSGESTTANSSLDDAIFYERCKEFIGEGWYFYDLVRTRRIINSNFAKPSMSTDEYRAGAWTWPINKSAQTQNPYVVLNTYWLN